MLIQNLGGQIKSIMEFSVSGNSYTQKKQPLDKNHLSNALAGHEYSKTAVDSGAILVFGFN